MKFIKDNFWWLIFAVITILVFISFFTIPNGHWLKRLILTLCGFGGVCIYFKGIFSILERFEENPIEYWKYVLLFCAFIVCGIATVIFFFQQ